MDNLFSIVLPILSYGSEIWVCIHKASDIERVHTKSMKQLLNVPQQTTNAAIYGERRIPVIVHTNKKILV